MGSPVSAGERSLAVNDSDLVVAVWDRRLHQGVLAAGVRVAPANLDADIQSRRVLSGPS
jgi:hypothetical protein